MKNKLIILNIALLLFFSSCSVNNSKQERSFQIIDSLGREVFFENYPERIVISGIQTPMLIDFYYLFPGAGEKLFAVENRVQTTREFILLIDPSIEKKMMLEKGAGVEQIAPLKPDLILMKDVMRDTVGKKLEEIGQNVVYLNFETIQRIQNDILILGKILNQVSRAEEINSQISLKMQEATEIVGGLSKKPTVLILQYSVQSGEPVFKVPSSDWLQTEMVEKAGGIPIWKDEIFTDNWSVITLEQIAAWDADYVFIVDYTGNPQKDILGLQNDPFWKELKATQNQKLMPFPKDHLSWDQPDPRWILGFSWLVEKLNPTERDLFSNNSTTLEFFTQYFGLSEEIFNKYIAPVMIVQ